jgi:hypothetical protein
MKYELHHRKTESSAARIDFKKCDENLLSRGHYVQQRIEDGVVCGCLFFIVLHV